MVLGKSNLLLLGILTAGLCQHTCAIRSVRLQDISSVQHGDGGKEEESWHDVEELRIEQKLDHHPSAEQPTSSLTLSQRYFYSSRYVNASSTDHALAFLCVGGEGSSLDKSVLVDSVHCTGDMLELAAKLFHEYDMSVHLFALEHRYYGKSYPVFSGDDDMDGSTSSPVTNEHLVYLSSRQAQADLAHFIQVVSNEQFFHANIKWITFGGSYPGMMAAWARLLYPDLVFAAVSNSAPIQVTVDFPQYKNHVSFDLQYERVGGSPECLNVVKEGHEQILSTLEIGDLSTISNFFQICNGTQELLIPSNVQAFLGDGVIQVPAQENDPSCTRDLCNIDKLCSALIEEREKSSPMEALAAIAKRQRADDETSCVSISWNDTLEYLKSPAAQEGGLRSWLWQTCTEMGFFQTCEESTCPFARGYHKLTLDFDICQQAFAIDPSRVAQSVQDTLKHYGGLDIPATRILSVNGNVDPWAELARTSKCDPKNDDLPTHWVQGASHHFWTHKSNDADSEDVRNAREIIYSQVMKWLEIEPQLQSDSIISKIGNLRTTNIA